MKTLHLTPDQLDAQASHIHDTAAWQDIIRGWEHTAPEDAPLRPEPGSGPRPGPEPGPEPGPGSGPVDGGLAHAPSRARPHAPGSADWRDLLSVPVELLIEESVRALPTPAPQERPLPGRLGAVLPERLHSWRRIGRPDVRPSTHLGHARRILVEWGWQNSPYRLRNARGARCICGAMLTAHRLGYGSLDTVDRAGAWMITELRSQGWTDLIGPWNRHPDRTAADALSLLDATIRRAARAGH